jgi:hypothetical protein
MTVRALSHTKVFEELSRNFMSPFYQRHRLDSLPQRRS